MGLISRVSSRTYRQSKMRPQFSFLCFICITYLSLLVSSYKRVTQIFEYVRNSNIPKMKELIAAHKRELHLFVNYRQDGTGQTPLMHAILSGKDEVDHTIAEKDGYTPMHGAGFQGRSEILKMLIASDRKINPSEQHSDGYTPIHRACWGRELRHTETVKTFVNVGGVAFDEITSDGRTCYEMTQNYNTKKFLEKMMNLRKNEEDKKRKEL